MIHMIPVTFKVMFFRKNNFRWLILISAVHCHHHPLHRQGRTGDPGSGTAKGHWLDRAAIRSDQCGLYGRICHLFPDHGKDHRPDRHQTGIPVIDPGMERGNTGSCAGTQLDWIRCCPLLSGDGTIGKFSQCHQGRGGMVPEEGEGTGGRHCSMEEPIWAPSWPR